MTPAELLKAFETLAEAPDGIARLRELVLQLAVRGKLVPQDPGDEPASVLLERIRAEQERLFVEMASKELKPSLPIHDNEIPFDVPSSWTFKRLGALGFIGSSRRVHQRDWQRTGIPFYRAREIVQLSRSGSVAAELHISEDLHKRLSASGPTPEPGDVMITGVGTIGVTYVVREGDCFYFKDASVLIFKNLFRLDPRFLGVVFRSPYWNTSVHQGSMGTTVYTLTIKRASEIIFPLPPLAEQRRIVERVDELMGLLDRLETAREARDTTSGTCQRF